MDLKIGNIYLDVYNYEHVILDIKFSDVIYLPCSDLNCSEQYKKYKIQNKTIFCDNMYNPIDLSVYDDYELYILNPISKNGFLKVCVKANGECYLNENVIFGLHKDGAAQYIRHVPSYAYYHRWVENGCKFRDNDKIFYWKGGKYKISNGVFQRVDIKSGNYIFDIKYNTPFEGCKDPNLKCNPWGVCINELRFY